MGVRWRNEDFLWTTEAGTNGVMVFDVNLQGTFERTAMLDFEYRYPRVWKQYKKLCLTGYNSLEGNAILIEDGGERVILMFTKRNRKETRDKMLENFKFALDKLFQILPKGAEVYSDVMGRPDKMWCEYFKVLTSETIEKDVTWNVCRENNRGVK